ncbi:2'-5' RNA ligase family protein [Pseudonocardia sp. GCM10023141]|uniref:2'-5' RNA ligase family protein n=1 Tax=Pseudonocardia sp. GCM10023141 TaxID=3252653 RepID=UPI00360C3815
METRPDFSAVVVAIPEADPLVGPLRAELDPAAGWGVPAHVSVLVPFVPPADLDAEVLAALGAVVAGVPAFTATFAEIAWVGETVVWLAPRPEEPFIALTRAVQDRFGLAAYEGRYGDEPVPHLTIGMDEPLPRLEAAAAQVAAGLPLRAEIHSVRVITGRRAADSWSTVAELALGPRCEG